MKRCPECESTFSDRIDFCFHDGSVLVGAEAGMTDGADPALDPPSLDDGLDLPSLDVPSPVNPGTQRRSDLTPVPLSRLSVPGALMELDEPPVSPLAAPPPPPRPGADLAAEAGVVDRGPSAGPSPSLDDTDPGIDDSPADGISKDTPITAGEGARVGSPPVRLDPSTASQPPLPPDSELREAPDEEAWMADRPARRAVDGDAAAAGDGDDPSEDWYTAVPMWAWVAGGVVTILVIGGAALFALGGLGALGAASARVAGNPDREGGDTRMEPQELTPIDEARFPEGDDERFPEEPLQVGVITADTDAVVADSDAADTDAAGVAEEPTVGTPDGGAPTDTGGSDNGPGLTVGVRPSDRGGPSGDGAGEGSAQGGSAGGSTTGGSTETPGSTDATTGGSGSPTAPTTDGAGTGGDPAASPWGVVTDPASGGGSEPAADLVAVTVSMDGDASDLTLYVDGKVQRGPWPHVVNVPPGMHMFRVTDTGGKEYEIGKPIRSSSTGSVSLQLMRP